jgi:hypothetical protein
MKLSISSQFDISAPDTWQLVKRSSTLSYITFAMISLKPIKGTLSPQWQQGNTEQMRIFLLGFIPAWRHKISFKKISDRQMLMVTHESGGIISRWHHHIRVRVIDQNKCHYSDQVDIQAGLFSPFVWCYAYVFYRYRQARWQRLINKHKAKGKLPD